MREKETFITRGRPSCKEFTDRTDKILPRMGETLPTHKRPSSQMRVVKEFEAEKGERPVKENTWR